MSTGVAVPDGAAGPAPIPAPGPPAPVPPGPPGGGFAFLACLDPAGNNVPSIVDLAIPDIAMSTFKPGIGPVILYRPQILAAHPTLKAFIYLHECGHHALGQILAGANGMPLPPTIEIAADCWALVKAAGLGMTQSQFQMIQAALVANPPKPPYYPPGAVRAQFMAQCLASQAVNLPP